jgi:putative transposase
MIKAHKIRLNPRPEQAVYFMKAAGTARYAYNWAVAQWRNAEGKKPTALELKKRFNAEKPDWVYEVTKCAAEGAFTDFGTALTNFYEHRAGEPQFKKRSKGDFKFKLVNVV